MPVPTMNHPTAPQNSPASARPDADDLSAPATQIVRDRDAYLGQNRDVGRRLSDTQVELFVADDPAVSLQREFERLAPQYIALHDVGASSSLRLLQAMAATTGRVMRMTIRRQGHGVALATIQFVEIMGSDGSALRVYSTDIDADTHTRQLLARTLLAHARLAVLVFGDLPAHALAASMQPLVEAVGHERWPNRQMLMIPLGLPTPLKSYVSPFGSAGINVTVAARVARATDAWSIIGSTWNELDEETSAPPPAPAYAPTVTDDSEAPTQPMGLPGTRGAHAQGQGQSHPHAGINWFDYVQRCASVKGMISCCVFDRSNGHALAHAGGRPPAEVMQALGERLLATAGDIGAMMGTGTAVTEATISYATHHMLLRTLPRQPGVVLHALLDATTGNVALARAQLQRLDPP
jgi:hypothetical protein